MAGRNFVLKVFYDSFLDENGTGRLHRSDFEFMMMNIGDRYNQQQFDDLLRDVEVAEDGTFGKRKENLWLTKLKTFWVL